MLEKSATMNRRGRDKVTILKRYRSTEKSPQIGTMRRAATRLLTPHDERNLKRRLKYQAMSAEDREELNEKQRLKYQAMSAEDREKLNEKQRLKNQAMSAEDREKLNEKQRLGS